MLERFDTIYGKVVGVVNGKGSYVATENGETAFLPKYIFPYETNVVCTVSKITEEGFAFLKLDSVFYDVA